MIDIEEILKESVKLEISGLKDDDELKEVLELIAFIQESGIYLYMSNEMAEAFTSFTANKLSVRRFTLGLTERFLTKLAVRAPDPTSAAKFVSDTLNSLCKVTSATRSVLQNQNALLVEPIQFNLKLENIESLLDNNPAFYVLYLAEVTGVFRTAITELE